MKVKFLTSISTLGATFSKGNVCDLSELQAHQWEASGYVTILEEPAAPVAAAPVEVRTSQVEEAASEPQKKPRQTRKKQVVEDDVL
jgi:hypothetical protein